MEKWIYWIEELGKEYNDIVGKKCANLGELAKAGFPTPPGFALSLEAYKRFMRETGAREEIIRYTSSFSADPDDPQELPKYKQLRDVLRRIVEVKAMPADMEETIRAYYTELCKKTGLADVNVAVRSAGPTSHPGQYETYLHVKGADNVIKHIIKVWSSTFNRRSIVARVRQKLPIHSDPIGVAVLKMVDARTAGVMFTLNPANGDTSQIVIDGCWGLGEGVVSGSTAVDQWIINKVTLEIVEKKVVEKKVHYELDQKSGAPAYIEVPPEKQNIPCMSDEEAIRLAEIGKGVERHFGVPQDIEWAIDKTLSFPDSIVLLQARPEKTFARIKSKSVAEGCTSALDYMSRFAKTPVRYDRR